MTTEVFFSAIVIRTKATWGLCLGKHIIIGEKASNKSLQHEFGHHLQWKKLGLLYYIVIAIPSLLHCIVFCILGRRWNYYSFYTEAWANSLSSKFFKE